MTSVDICNMALSYLGNSRPITTLADDTTESRLCSQFYDISRESLLGEFNWKFATKKYVSLVEVTDETNEIYDCVYEYPFDALKDYVLYVGDGAEIEGFVYDYDIIYTLDGSTNVRRIVCDIPNAKASYIIDLKDTDMFPVHFCTALAWRVSLYISIALSKDSKLIQSLSQSETAAIAKAQYHDSKQGKEAIHTGNRYINARGGSSYIRRR